ncbi:MAG: hypothetical protein JWM05_1455 [Acidimicrobiales bacterium]|nr:hypothetical protein [Acidimicrobiales bacterium]
MTEPSEAFDTGLSAARTELAWGRSILSLLGCGVAVLKGVPRVTGSSGRPAVGIALLAVGALAWLGGVPYARTRQQARRDGVGRAVSRRDLAPVAIGTAAVGIAAFVLAAFLPS